MTLPSTSEMKIDRRGASTAPADAAAKVLGVVPKGDTEKASFSTLVRWSFGTSGGAVRGLLGVVGSTGPIAAAVHFGAIWGNDVVMLPALRVAPRREWGAKVLATGVVPSSRLRQGGELGLPRSRSLDDAVSGTITRRR